ncbi:hypothetical protein [Streptomyces ficellus]|uniref:Uncharacterized protein n=1 Tax=Streptomyces ficellus TaxID=1977088 RepID=A0A6I6FG23_9ACTN|nr:hypothetical protein [Streptomyces ficellus]QGV77449.1 hypothetical protein EIZ62_03685 [Streptomyces ficellus]
MEVRPIAAVAAVTLLVLGSTASGAAAGGRALEGAGAGSHYSLGFETFVAGKGYWFNCPPLTNVSSVPVDVLGAEILGAPAHWRTGEVRAVDFGDDPVALGAVDATFDTEPLMRNDRSKSPVRIAPGERSTVHYMVRVEARSASGAGAAEGCRFTYRSGHRVYVEELGANLYLGPPPR